MKVTSVSSMSNIISLYTLGDATSNQILLFNQWGSTEAAEDVILEIKTELRRGYSLRIQGEKSYVSLQKDSIRSILSLPSSKIRIVKYGDIPDEVSVKSSQGTTTRQIGTSYIKCENGQYSKAREGQ